MTDSGMVLLVPVVMGAILLLAITVIIARGTKHPNVMGLAFVVSAALCGSSVFASLTWGADGVSITTIAGATETVAKLAKSNNQRIDSIDDALSELNNKISAISDVNAIAQDIYTSSFNDKYKFSSDSVWGNIIDSDFCRKNNQNCSEIQFTNDNVIVPKNIYESYVNSDLSGIIDPASRGQADELTNALDTYLGQWAVDR